MYIFIIIIIGILLYFYFTTRENMDNIHTKQYNEAKKYLLDDYELKLKDLNDMHKKNIIEFSNDNK